MPRNVALDLLDAILNHKRLLEASLDHNPDYGALVGRDRALAHNLVATTLRRMGQIDNLIDHCLDKPMPRKALAARHILRIGVCQLMFLRIPAHAAVDTTVELTRKRDQGAYVKLVNAVLRRLAKEGKKLLDAQDAARLNTPDWMWQSWSKTYGAKICRAIAEAHLQEAPLDITAPDNTAEWAKKLNGEILPTGSLRLFANRTNGPIKQLPGFKQGAWWVQDTAASLPVKLLGDVKNLNVIDLCAAPGGKTAQLANMGAYVTAIDISAKRLERLEQNLQRLNIKVKTIAADVNKWQPSQLADAVLLDAPCSASGTIRRHPDVAHLKTASDVTKLALAQGKLLTAAAKMLKPGGVLVYSSCSLEPTEGVELIEKFLANNPLYKRSPISAGETGVMRELVSDKGDIRSLPCHMSEKGGMDGFYAVRLVLSTISPPPSSTQKRSYKQ